jgi:hypothetical protein
MTCLSGLVTSIPFCNVLSRLPVLLVSVALLQVLSVLVAFLVLLLVVFAWLFVLFNLYQ